MASYVEITREQARSLITSLQLEGHTNGMMGGTFWYPPGSPTGYPHVAVAFHAKEWDIPERWSARADLLTAH